MENFFNSYLNYIFSTGRIIIPVMVGFFVFRLSIRILVCSSFSVSQKSSHSKVSLKKETFSADPCKLPESNTDFIQLN